MEADKLVTKSKEEVQFQEGRCGSDYYPNILAKYAKKIIAAKRYQYHKSVPELKPPPSAEHQPPLQKNDGKTSPQCFAVQVYTRARHYGKSL